MSTLEEGFSIDRPLPHLLHVGFFVGKVEEWNNMTPLSAVWNGTVQNFYHSGHHLWIIYRLRTQFYVWLMGSAIRVNEAYSWVNEDRIAVWASLY